MSENSTRRTAGVIEICILYMHITRTSGRGNRLDKSGHDLGLGFIVSEVNLWQYQWDFWVTS